MARQNWDIGRAIDAVIEPFNPALARRRHAQRMALHLQRQYDAATGGRRNQGWRRPSTSADREVGRGLVGLRNGARELVRNNKYASAALRQIVANLVGDGIEGRATHSNPEVAKRAQAAWAAWCKSKVDGRRDFYGVQSLATRSMVEGGESLIVWGPDETGPDGRVRVLEGDLLDHLKENSKPGAGRIVQGVEFDGNGDRAAYWIHDHHPGDAGGWGRGSSRYAARNIDHLFEELRPGQTRGVSWFAPVAMTLRDAADFEDAVLMKKKVEACLALILTPGEKDPNPGPFGELEKPTGDQAGKASSIETVRPGMIFRARPGETATSVNPSSSGDGVDFIRQQLAAVAANLVPYHLMTGDVSQANYSSLRAALLGFWANLDDWQQNVLVPFMCQPAFDRRMRRLALETGDRRFLEVQASWAMPIRRFVDPLKDVAGLVAELRTGLVSLPQVLAARGLNTREHLQEIADTATLLDELNLVLECDPRKVTQSGVLQAAHAAVNNEPKGN